MKGGRQGKPGFPLDWYILHLNNEPFFSFFSFYWYICSRTIDKVGLNSRYTFVTKTSRQVSEQPLCAIASINSNAYVENPKHW